MTYIPRLPLKAHQLEAIAKCRAKPTTPCSADVWAYLCEMGTGKSAICLAEFGQMATTGGPKDLLVLAPKSCLRNWYRPVTGELDKHCDPAFRESLSHHTWIGSGVGWKRKMDELLATPFDDERPRALFVNIEALSNANEKALDLCLEFCNQRGAHVVVDESTTIKANSNRTEAAIRIGEAAQSKRILSGLWTPKSPLDLFWQCAFLDERILGFKNFFTFQARYAEVVMTMNWGTGRKFPQVVGFRNQEELADKVAKYSYRILKRDCLDLEPKTYAPRDVELTAQQKKMLTDIKSFGYADIGDTGRHVTTDMVIKAITRKLQIGCGYVMDDEERVLHEIPETRTNVMLEVLEEHSGKAIIWCPWHPPLQRIVKRLTEEYGPQSVAQFHGKNVSTRDDEENRFLNDPECRFMVATQAAGMRGNTWVVADLVIYYANNYDLEQREQSEDRAHRIGQVNRVTYVDLIAQGTIENKVIQNLRDKIDLATAINREGYRSWII